MELSQPREVPSQCSSRRTRRRSDPPPATRGSRFPLRLPKTSKTPAAAHRKRRSPPPPPGQSTGTPPESTAVPGDSQTAPATTPASLTSQARPPRLRAGPQPPPRRAGLGRAAPRNTRNPFSRLRRCHRHHGTPHRVTVPPVPPGAGGSGAGSPPRRSHRAASRTGNNRKGAGP